MKTATPNTAHSNAKLRRVGAYAAAVFLGGMFGLIVVFVMVRQSGEGSLPAISAEDLRRARQKWDRADITNYAVKVVVRGRDVSSYRVNVRDGVVQAAFRDDQPLRQERTWGTWSIQGMFETIETDMPSFELHREGKAELGTPQLALRGEFDDKLGIPRRYQRTEMRKFGSNLEVSWEVAEFSRLE